MDSQRIIRWLSTREGCRIGLEGGHGGGGGSSTANSWHLYGIIWFRHFILATVFEGDTVSMSQTRNQSQRRHVSCSRSPSGPGLRPSPGESHGGRRLWLPELAAAAPGIPWAPPRVRPRSLCGCDLFRNKRPNHQLPKGFILQPTTTGIPLGYPRTMSYSPWQPLQHLIRSLTQKSKISAH